MINQDVQEIWKNYHNDSNARMALSLSVRKAWESGLRLELPPDYRPEPLSHEELRVRQSKCKKLVIYGTSIIVPFLDDNDEDDRTGYLLFDQSGCLMNLFGSPSFLMWAAMHFIRVGTDWNDPRLGPNAVSLGLKLEKPIVLKGGESYNQSLADAFFAFSPITLESGELYGGLVYTGPAERFNDNALSTAIGLATAIDLQLYWSRGFFNIYGAVGKGIGMITLDQSIGQNRILIMSAETINVLGIPPKDYFYERLERLIPDIPANAEFWELVSNRTIVSDLPLTLNIGGRPVSLCISIMDYLEQKFHMSGITIVFNSMERINNIMSKFSASSTHYHFSDIIGHSDAMRNALQRAEAASETDINILLTGPSGVGKDIFAQAIHNNSNRRNQPFVAINCASFSKDLIASELFGYESGAFTGARKEGAIGKLELANHGTLFLDEIGDMPLDLQAILLRVLEEKSFWKVGGKKLIRSDVRIITATNRNLVQLVQNGLFREDLFYRLGIIRINIPPLKDRGEDMIELAENFSRAICSRLSKPQVLLSPGAVNYIRSYAWPGNVRELKNTLEGIISTCPNAIITENDFSRYIEESGNIYNSESVRTSTAPILSVAEAVPALYDEPAEFAQALRKFRGNKTKAAEYLGIPLSTFYRRLKKYNLI